MYNSSIELLHHILDEVSFVLTQTKNLPYEHFMVDGVLQRAIIRSLEIIGEASKKLSPEFRFTYPQIDWKEMAGTRDKLIHDYFGVDLEIVWDIVINELPELHGEILRIMEMESK